MFGEGFEFGVDGWGYGWSLVRVGWVNGWVCSWVFVLLIFVGFVV